MKPWNGEGMEGAAHVGASARVIEFPSQALALRGERVPAAPAAGDPDSPEAAAKTIHEIARSNVMRSLITIVLFAAVALSALFAARAANANEPPGSRNEVSLLGGVHSVNQNDTAIPDNMAGVPVVGAVSYQLSPNFAAEGEFTWFIPVTQSVDMGGGVSQDRKAPDALAYQVGLRASYPLSTWSPYLAAGAGAMTFLSSSGADRTPSLDKAETMFAIDFGGGGQFPLNARLALRADFREFVGFPSDGASGLSANGSADPIWMERGTVGLDYHF